MQAAVGRVLQELRGTQGVLLEGVGRLLSKHQASMKTAQELRSQLADAAALRLTAEAKAREQVGLGTRFILNPPPS